MERRRVIVRGRVQGVGFRAWVAREARAAGVAGWVRNRVDGAVEAVFEGPREAVALCVTRCSSGPRHADVERVDASEEPPEGLSAFVVR